VVFGSRGEAEAGNLSLITGVSLCSARREGVDGALRYMQIDSTYMKNLPKFGIFKNGSHCAHQAQRITTFAS